MVACTARNPDYCTKDSDCSANVAKPFCDVNGEFDESNHTANLCTPTPAECPAERCGCEPGLVVSCTSDQLVTCAADGHSTYPMTCGLGCSSATGCATFEPSNGLGAAIASGYAEPDVTIPTGAKIDTTTGTVFDGDQPVTITSVLVDQAGGPPIRAFIARSFVIDDVIISGSNPIAFVAPGEILVKGHVDASANGIVKGPGAWDTSKSCTGQPGKVDMVQPCFNCRATGGGGGGNHSAGGDGGDLIIHNPKGGVAITDHTTLTGGCEGGDQLDPANLVLALGGGGGGAVQLDSFDTISFIDAGVIDVTGGGGPSGTGGGSGGMIVIESPTIAFGEMTTGLSGGGGSGGGCGVSGVDGAFGVAPPTAPTCHLSVIDPNGGGASAGVGGTATMAAAAGELHCPPPTMGQACSTSGETFQGGGGGAVGYARISTKSRTYVGSPLIAIAAATTGLPGQ